MADALGLVTEGAPSSCAATNQAALALAEAQLSAQELADYQASGNSVSFLADEAFDTGIQWLQGELGQTKVGSELQVRSPKLEVPLDTNLDDVFKGVHYCKLWSPSSALAYLLNVDADNTPPPPPPPGDDTFDLTSMSSTNNFVTDAQVDTTGTFSVDGTASTRILGARGNISDPGPGGDWLNWWQNDGSPCTNQLGLYCIQQ